MDKTEIRAKAALVWLDITITTPEDPPEDIIEASLTAAYGAGWDEGVEAAKVAYFEEGTVEAIRRLKKGK